MNDEQLDFGIIGTQSLQATLEDDEFDLVPVSPSQKWLGGWSNPTALASPSIWNAGPKSPSATSPGLPSHRRASLNTEVTSPIIDPQQRQNRSYSVSVSPYAYDKARFQPQPLFEDLEQDSTLLADFAYPNSDAKNRSRSKSSSATYGAYPNGGGYMSPVALTSPKSDYIASAPAQMPHDYQMLWRDPIQPPRPNNMGTPRSPHFPPETVHKRSSTTPTSYWPGSPEQYGEIESTDAVERYQQQRRFSHAPAYQDFLLPSQLDAEDELGTNPYDGKRRHSLAGPFVPNHFPLNLDALHISEPSGDAPTTAPIYKSIDEYFENTEHRTKAWVEAGKNLQLAQSAPTSPTGHTWPLYVVEFKAGRRDFFFIPENDNTLVKTGDLVIVEADRGKDLGKVIHFPLHAMAELDEYRKRYPDVLVSEYGNKEVVPKRIYRKATNPEIALLVPKSADEAKAMGVCQTKIRSRVLPMEIVDAEYQWDRRKLTFYFVSDRRIDFRELVRELFKLYKTRIWMCAVNQMQPEDE